MQSSEPTAGQVDSCLEQMIEGYETVRDALADADDIELPALHHVEEGAPIGSYLLEKGLVPRDTLDERIIDGMWVGAFFGQTGEVLDKLARIRRKGCSAIVSLHERIEAGYGSREG